MGSMLMMDEKKSDCVALGPLRWNLVKIRREWENKLNNLKVDAIDKTREVECKHRKHRRALAQRLKSSRDAVKDGIPLNGRLMTMKASRDNLTRLGRLDEAEKVRLKLEPLEKGFWAKALAEAGFTEQAKREKEKLLSAQQFELGSLNRALRRDIERTEQKINGEVKAQQRKNCCSSDSFWGIWFAAKRGDVKRLSHVLSLPGVDVDARDSDSGWSALHFASRQGKLGAVEALIDGGAFIGPKGPGGRTPLHLAAGWGTYEVCFALLNAGADKNVLDNDDQTPQHLAEARQRHRIVGVLRGWRPIGLTATQSQKIKEAREEGATRVWETEPDPEIRAQLWALDTKRASFGGKHAGMGITLGKIGVLCREKGRLKDAKQYLEQLVELLQDSAAGHTQPKGSKTSSTSAPSGGAQALTVACGNLGVVCHELGDAEQASSLLQASLRFSLFAAAESVSEGNTQNHMIRCASRNLGIHYLSEGMVEEARPQIRKWLEISEGILKSNMPGEGESEELIPVLTLLSYADMLAGDHTSAAGNAERARTIAAKYRIYGDQAVESCLEGLGAKAQKLSDPIARLEWMGVQRFVAKEHASAAEFFAQARALVCTSQEISTTSTDSDCDGFNQRGGAERRGRRGEKLAVARPTLDNDKAMTREGSIAAAAMASNGVGGNDRADIATGEFHPQAMRLDRCMAVAICRQGPGAF